MGENSGRVCELTTETTKYIIHFLNWEKEINMQERIKKDMKKAMKEGDRETVKVLRMLISDFNNRRIEKGEELEREDYIQVLKKGVKSRKESVEEYEKGGREDLAEKEKREIETIKQYLPEQLDEGEIEDLVEETIDKLNAAGMRDMGKVMGKIMKEHKTVVDGNTVKEIVKEKLSE